MTAALALCSALGGCAGAAGGNDRPLTPAEREQFVRAAQARTNGIDPRQSPCRLSSRAAQVQARDGRYQGPDFMDTKGCEPSGQ